MGLKDRFAARQAPQQTIRLRMDFSPESDTALRALAAAESDLESAKARRDADLHTYEKAVERARASADTFYETLTVRALPPDEMDALLEAHPPTEDQKAQAVERGWAAPHYNTDTLAPELLAACIDGDMTASDWSELVSKGPVSVGEMRMLTTAAFDINDRSPDPDLGKG